MLRKLKLRLRALFRRDHIGDELTLHLEQLTDELIAQGLSLQEARLAARRQFGNIPAFRNRATTCFHLGWWRISCGTCVTAGAAYAGVLP